MSTRIGPTVILDASISPSEDPASVLAAMGNILGGAPSEKIEDAKHIRLEARSRQGLQRIKEQLRDRRVRAAARKRLLSGIEGSKTVVMLNRQAASTGVVAICDRDDESPLGPIWLTILSDDLGGDIQWLTDYPEG